MAAAKFSGPIVETLLADVVATDAVHVRELALSDWQRLSSWHGLRVMEARRLEAVLGSPAAPGALWVFWWGFYFQGTGRRRHVDLSWRCLAGPFRQLHGNHFLPQAVLWQSSSPALGR